MASREARTDPDTGVERTVQRTGAAHVTLVPRNFVLGVLNGALVQITARLLDPNTVIPLLVIFLTGREELVGVLIGLRLFGVALPQVFMPGIAARMPRKRQLYVISAVSRSVMLWALFVLMFYVDRLDAMLLFWVMALLMMLFSSAVGVGLLAFFDIVAKTIPPEWRGRLQAHRWFWGGMLGLAGGALVTWLFDEERSGLSLAQCFQILMGLGALAGTLGAACFCFVSEPEGHSTPRKSSFVRQFRWGMKLFRADRNLRQFVWFKTVGGLAVCAYAYCAIFARQTLGLSASDLGYFIIAQQIGQLGSVPIFGRISDRHGNRSIMIFSSFIYVLIPILVIAAPGLPEMAGGFAVGLWWFKLVFFLMGVAQGGLVVATVYFPLEFAPEKRRPIYLALIQLFTIPLSVFPAMAGLLFPWIGYLGLWLLMFAGAIFCVIAARALQEPRKGLKMMQAQS